MHVKDFRSENYCEHCLYNITRRGLMVKMDVKLLRRYNWRQYFVDRVRLLCNSSANSVMTAWCLLLLHFIVCMTASIIIALHRLVVSSQHNKSRPLYCYFTACKLTNRGIKMYMCKLQITYSYQVGQLMGCFVESTQYYVQRYVKMTDHK